VRKELRKSNYFKALYHKTSRALRYYIHEPDLAFYRNHNIDIDLLIADRKLVYSVLKGKLKRTIESDLACKRILKVYGGSSIDLETGKSIKSCHVTFNSLRKIYAALISLPYHEFNFDSNDPIFDSDSVSVSDSDFELLIKKRLLRS